MYSGRLLGKQVVIWRFWGWEAGFFRIKREKHTVFSWFRRDFLSFLPPGAEKPPVWPSERIMRWQGIIRGIGFLAKTFATARAELGWPISSAKAA